MSLQDKLVTALGNLEQKVSPYLPFSLLNVVWQNLDKRDKASLLDVGCGKGEPMKFINRRRQLFTVGIDIFETALREAQMQGSHNEYVLGDVRKLPFRQKSFDIVLCMEILEHLERAEGFALLQALEEIARRQVIVTTPVGLYKQDAFDGNPYQVHKSVWSPQEMKRLGYKVRGVQIRGTNFTTGLLSHLPRLLRIPIHVAWYLAGPFVYFLPELSGDIICSKKTGTRSKK
jgi:SAM-dependent methyltransferase